MGEAFPQDNNLNWLRLIFAWQVVLFHAGEHLGGSVPLWLHSFPGVPAFFFVSGFLIYHAYQSKCGRHYWRNRFLRLFPGLFVVTLAGVAVALVAHGWRDLLANPLTYLSWVGAQLTLGQAYNPGHFRDVGVGVINGALWTITTEILFYMCVPIIVWVERRWRFTVHALIVASLAVYGLGPALLSQPISGDKTLYDAVALTPIAWGWMFGFGILAVKHWSLVARWIKWFPIAIAPVLFLIWLGWSDPLFGSAGNRLGVVYFAPYAALILWLAFATPHIRLENDFSYGTYIWHMPVINLLLVLAVPNALWWAFALTALMAAVSWFLVEKPAKDFGRGRRVPVSPDQDAVPA